MDGVEAAAGDDPLGVDKVRRDGIDVRVARADDDQRLEGAATT
jgi:hypothetical protein